MMNGYRKCGVYIYTMEYYAAFKKELLLYLCYNMDELQGHYAKLNKPVKKGKYYIIPLI